MNKEETGVDLPIVLLKVNGMTLGDLAAFRNSLEDSICFAFLEKADRPVDVEALKIEIAGKISTHKNVHLIAGYERGGLTGMTCERPLKVMLDSMYDLGINPIVPDPQGVYAFLWGTRFIKDGQVWGYSMMHRKYEALYKIHKETK